ncbi:hypothetical protein A2U01_0110995, partial [Trifolium medium]|nr:hypothetical protein [Trifolium medium]
MMSLRGRVVRLWALVPLQRLNPQILLVKQFIGFVESRKD